MFSRATLLALVLSVASAFVAPVRSVNTFAARAPQQLSLEAVPDSSLLVSIGTLIAPSENELSNVFGSPFFIAFFILSITGGLPALTWIRLKTLGGPDSP